jgi:hypothetical protein
MVTTQRLEVAERSLQNATAALISLQRQRSNGRFDAREWLECLQHWAFCSHAFKQLVKEAMYQKDTPAQVSGRGRVTRTNTPPGSEQFGSTFLGETHERQQAAAFPGGSC